MGVISGGGEGKGGPAEGGRRRTIILSCLDQNCIGSSVSGFNKGPVTRTVNARRFALLRLVPRHNISLRVNSAMCVKKSEGREAGVREILKVLPFRELATADEVRLSCDVESVIRSGRRGCIGFFGAAKTIDAELRALRLVPNVNGGCV